ncbi:N-formylglutamate amidohydrolase [Frigidibacter sp. MR17.24]|uniref:N-formylglutamate amidohydrolase n=1 Tax=Frigidibacter sp. MR17.24 TaxID=3127345 RepID=UPI0030130E2F
MELYEDTPSYRLRLPHRPAGAVVFASPHSGNEYPKAFLDSASLDPHAIRSSEDAFMDRLLAPAPGAGAPLLSAVLPRAFVDLNRAADELDPALIEGVRGTPHNPRVASGLGVIPRVVSAGRVIRQGKMPRAEAEARLALAWHPYHRRLSQLLDQTWGAQGQAILVDMHSMPHEAVEQGRGPRPQVVIGDRFGATASAGIVHRIEAAFEAEGLRVGRNVPFAGAYVVQVHGRPASNRHAVQIEIDRALYMDERTITPHAGFDDFAALIGRVMARIIDIGRAEAEPLAAE